MSEDKKNGKQNKTVKPFDPMTLRGVTVRNRIWLPPMDTYSALAQDGKPTPFHYQHYVSRAMGGFGMIIMEATAVAPEGRISPCDLGLWDDGQMDAWRWIVADAKAAGATMAVQLNHAGRKGSTGCHAIGFDGQSVPEEQGGWRTVCPSANAYGSLARPRALSVDEIHTIVDQFRDAAWRAMNIGFDAVEVHAAHGYLLSQFLDPLINERDDEYGGSFDNRVRMLVEVVDAIRSVVPDTMPVLVRVSATDWAAGGWDLDQTVELAKILKAHGVDRISVNPQTLDDRVLETIGRRHTADDIRRAMEQVRAANFPHVNMDLIAGLPEDTPEGFARSLDEVISMGADNITVHTLSLKKGSRIMLEGSRIPGADEVAQMLDYADPTLRKHGFAPYYLYRQKYMSGSFENVGWTKPGGTGLYNIYIMEELHSILSLGAGGSTKMVGGGQIRRAFNAKYPREYIDRPEKRRANLMDFARFYAEQGE